MIETGKYNTLKAARSTNPGFYLEDEEGNDILLPNRYVPEGLKVGDKIKVFVYLDSENRLIATTLNPIMTLNEIGVVKVKSTVGYGAFVDWGLAKDLLVPASEQHVKLKEGQMAVVYLYLDEASNRLAGSTKVHNYLKEETLTVEEGEEVDLLVISESELGMQVLINKQHIGLVFHSDVLKPLQPGDQLKGYIKQIRPDGKIDVTLQMEGYKNIEPNAQKLLDSLKRNGGRLPFTDKSDPGMIRKELNMSKKTFKKAIGALYKKRLIMIEDGGIRYSVDR